MTKQSGPPLPDRDALERLDDLARWDYIHEHFEHWYREPIAGVIALAVGVYDAWMYGRDKGLTSSLDEILILTGVALIAGVRNLFPSWRSKAAAARGDRELPKEINNG